MEKQVRKINQYCHSETIYPKFRKGERDKNQVCLWKINCVSIFILDWFLQGIRVSQYIQMPPIPCNTQLYSSVSFQRLIIAYTGSYTLKRKQCVIFENKRKVRDKERDRWSEICWMFVLRMKHCLPRQDKSEMTTSLESISVGIWIILC